MADLFEPLRETRDQPLTPPLPPEEVRRRGDRLRRRRTVLAAAGATLGVVVVVGGGLALGGGLPSASGPTPAPPASQAPEPTPEPTDDASPTGDATTAPAPAGDWRTTIPVGFPLAGDLVQPRSTEEEELAGPGRDVRVFDRPFQACGRSVDLGAPEDSLGVRHTAPEWFDGRVLQVYADDEAARQVLFELVRLYEFCEEDVFPGPPDTVAGATVRPVPHGEEGYLVTRTYSVDGMRVPGLELLHVVRVGNAVLVSSLANEGGADDASVARQLGERDPLVGAVAAAMCVFSQDGCTRDGVLGPRGLGRVLLGMAVEEAESSGAVLEDAHGQGCTTFGLLDAAGDPSAVGFLNADQGVSVLLVDRRGVLTPEGIGVGATEERVRAAYPAAVEVPMGLVVPVPGFADREYTFAFEDGRLVEMALRLTGQTCVG